MIGRHGVIAVQAVITVVFIAAQLGMTAVINRADGADHVSWQVAAINILTTFTYTFVGALIRLKRPENGIGWIFLGLGVYLSIEIFFRRYAFYGILVDRGSLPLAEEVGSVLNVSGYPGIGAILATMLLFPGGRPGPGTGRALWVLGLATAGNIVSTALGFEFTDWPFQGEPNLFYVERLAPAAGFLGFVSFLGFLAVLLYSVAGLVRRFRRSRGDERQQYKWFALAGMLLLLLVLSYVVSDLAAPGVLEDIEVLSLDIVSTALPLAVGLGILRYRLYDIDRVINRTLTYAVLTAVLAAMYLGLVLALQEALRPLSGGSDLAVALTTLIVAALFLPARRRVQAVVDRRFNRRAYDASLTLDAFSARLRQHIDLDTLRYELLSVVDETMQPSSVGLWLRRQGEK